MKKTFLSLLLLATSLNPLASIAQEKSMQKPFKPHGKAIVTIFSDAQMRFENGDVRSSFNLRRSYLGYKHQFTEAFGAKVQFDITNDKSIAHSNYSVYVKNAFLSYKTGKVLLNAGMISTDLYTEAETMWGKRYLLKNVIDLADYGSSADIGVGIHYSPTKWLKIKAQVINGEGYKRLQGDSAMKVTGELVFYPIPGMILSVYADAITKGNAQHTLKAFLGYKDQHFALGGEVSYQGNSKMILDHNMLALSFWGNYDFNSQFNVFARYDNVSLKKINHVAWNAQKENQLFALGIEYKPIKAIHIAPNVQIRKPKAEGSKVTTDAMINLGVFF